jgi:hypothetical protein
MRMVFVLAAVAMLSRSAHARHLWEDSDTPVYPDELVDRPLLLLPGMTEIGAGYALHSHDQLRFLDYAPDLSVAHSFGPLQIDAQIGGDAALAIEIPLGRFPDALVVGASTSPRAADETMFVSQFVEAEHKFHIAPQSIAFVVSLGAAYSEEHIRVPGLRWVGIAGGVASAEIEIQLASVVAFYGGGSIGIPIAASNGQQFEATFGVRGGVSLTLAHSWDLFASAALGADQARTSYSLGGGVEKRFGP